ncbi:MAG: sugar nucleotide-binding protein [Clostridium sp.]|uniref:sugar nucleotide-binding protein n=1 Tax=Clostridium sp. TaxID=1506 RepID=UPI002A890EA4|nr:sugar nucleotide-binding protein [Clostridium sp.]MDY5097438.1 sugar nucleotide-binding protein [Clostridium sp.]
MRILVLGASGYAGSRIFNDLSKDHEVYGTYYSQETRIENQSRMIRFDIADSDKFSEILEIVKPDIIISSLRGDYEAQKVCHKQAAKYISEKTGGKLIFLSTANVFDNELNFPHYEEDKLQSQTDYGKFKIQCENMLEDILGEKSIIIRIPLILGKDCPLINRMKSYMKNNESITLYENLFVNYTLDIQISKYIQYILEEDLNGIFHIGSRDSCDYAEFFKELANRMGFENPDFNIETSLDKKYQIVFTSRRDIPEALQMSVRDVIDYVASS